MLEELDSRLQSVVDQLIERKQDIDLLEVGCGSCSHLSLPENTHMVGIDISEKQLERNHSLDEKILADVETYDLPSAKFDLIVCWWILEHLAQPTKVLDNCQQALKKDGLMIVAVPNVMSIKGLITKYTPHSFHVWVYRYIFGEKNAGVDDQLPFKTYLRYSLSVEAIEKFARSHNLAIEHLHIFENPRQKHLRARHWLIDTGWKLLQAMTKTFTFGKIDAELTDFIVVLKQNKSLDMNQNQSPQMAKS